VITFDEAFEQWQLADYGDTSLFAIEEFVGDGCCYAMQSHRDANRISTMWFLVDLPYGYCILACYECGYCVRDHEGERERAAEAGQMTFLQDDEKERA
jgi:hypothetical protein